MEVQIEFSEMKSSDALRDQINNEVEKIEERYDWVIKMLVYLKIERKDKERGCTCEIETRVPGEPIFVQESNDRFEVAIANAFSVMTRQLAKKKELMYNHKL